jgi:hypothetical protein
MRAGAGVVAELLALACILALAAFVPGGFAFGVYVIAAELLTTYLVHCPAHYIVGAILGVRFRSISKGRTTLARALPQGIAGFARALPILTLRISEDPARRVSNGRLASMFVAGTAASCASAFVIALLATPVDTLFFAALAWAVAIGYLLFDVVFSPKSGDLARARRALRS